MNGRPRIGIPDLLSYGVLALPLAFAGMPLYLYAPDFYVTGHGMSLAAIGMILLFIRIFDAVQDPLIGWASDRLGAARGVVVGGGILAMGISFFMLFHPPESHVALWFGISMALLTTAFSVISINLNTLGGIWTTDTHDKTRITATREMFGLVGVLLAAALPAIFMRDGTQGETFHLLSLVFMAVLLLAGLVFMSWLFSFNAPNAYATGDAKRPHIAALWRAASKDLRRFYLIYFISMLASAIPVVLVIFFVRDRLLAEEYLGLFLAVYFLSGAAGMPLWHFLARRYGKLASWAAAMALAIAGFIWAYFLGIGDVKQFFVICAVSGLALGAELALPPSILSDIVDRSDSRASAATQFSVQTFLSKLALAVATGTVFPVLDMLGYQPDNVEDCCLTTVHGVLSVSYAVVPCAIKYVSLRLLLRWRSEQNTTDKGATGEENSRGNTSDSYGSTRHA